MISCQKNKKLNVCTAEGRRRAEKTRADGGTNGWPALRATHVAGP